MKSIAIWYEPLSLDNKKLLSQVELHFNFWKIPNGSNDTHKFLDIGIKLVNTENVNSLNIYFPKIVSPSDFEDIVSKFIDKADLVSAIFNENYKVVSEATSKFFQIKNSDGDHVFSIYKSSSNDLKFQNTYGGTIISIKVPRQSYATYYRFRLKGDFVNSLSTISKPTNAVLDSAFSEIEMIDFRVNEIRDLNRDLLEKIRDEALLRISKAHFFFICPNEEDVIGNHQPYGNCRNLEHYRWNDYVDLPKSSGNVFLAYHWKDCDKESVSILIKTKYEKNNWKTIGKYIAVGFIIAVFIELFSNWLYDVLKGAILFKCN